MTATKENRPPMKRRDVPWIVGFYRSDVGKKYVMALSGIALLGFIVFHMIGNLHAFEGAHQINEYGEGLRDLGEPIAPRTFLLWIARLGLAGAFAIHIHAAYALTRKNVKARGEDYGAVREYYAATYASRTMRWGGVIILLFLLWHLADLTWGVDFVNPGFERGDVYGNLQSSLSRWWVVLIYLTAQIALAAHVWHGAWSMFQSLGVNNPKINSFRRKFASVLSVVVMLGYLSVPFGITFGVIH